MHTHIAASKEEARSLSAADPQKIVLDQHSGNIWTGDVTLVPVRQTGNYLCYADHSLDAIGAVQKTESGLWVGMHMGEALSLHPTVRDAALDLSNATKN